MKHVGQRRMARLLAACSGIISLVSLTGYILNVAELYQWRPGSVGMAINTAFSLLLLVASVIMLSLPRDHD